MKKTINVNIDLSGMIRSIRNKSFPFKHALLELVDNSVDACAKEIDIKEIAGDLKISDNGQGFDDIAAAVTLGKSSKTSSIGRYGIGMKEACAKFSNTTVIASKESLLTVPWEEISEGISDGELEEETRTDDGKTTVTLCGFRPSRYKQEIQTDDIQKVYHPLISSGLIAISINGEKLSPLPMPKIEKQISVAFQYEDKSVTIFGGTFNPGDENRRHWFGYNIYYMGRLIGGGNITKKGVGNEACTNFCYIVELLDGSQKWELSTNKDEVEDIDELLNHIYHNYTEPQLKIASEQSREIGLKDIEDSITQKLNGNQTRKPVKQKEGTVKPKQEGAPKKNTYTAKADGVYNSNGHRTGSRSTLLFKFSHLGSRSLCEVQEQKKIIIIANLDNPFIEQNKDNEPVLLCLAKTVFAMMKNRSVMGTVPDECIRLTLDTAGNELFDVNENEEKP